LAGFQVATYGRFWVATEVVDPQHLQRFAALRTILLDERRSMRSFGREFCLQILYLFGGCFDIG
jgi:hypothetical protein